MRNIKKEMITYLDRLLEKNGLAKHHVQNKNPRGLMVEAAKVCVGITELTGKNDGFYVNLIQDTVGGPDESPWCMSFQQTLISYSEIKTGIACKLLATEHCLTLFNWVKKNHPEMLVKNNPLSGAIAIWQHGDTQKGHTGLVLDSDENIFYAVEGNASGYLSKEKAISGKINREGNGVFYTKRSRAGDGNMKLLGFIKPWEYPS